MNKFKISILAFLSILSYSSPSLKLETKYENNKEGLIYKDIKGPKFYNEKTISGLSTNVEFGFSENIKINGKISKSNKNTNANYMLGLDIVSPEYRGIKIGYSLKNYTGNDYLEDVKHKTNQNTFNLSYKDINSKLEIKNLEDINFNLKNENFEIGVKKIHNVENHLKNMRNLQNEIYTENDGHSHDHNLGELDALDYSINQIEDTYKGKYIFSDYNLKFATNWGYKINKKINLNTKLNYSFNNLYSNAANNFISDLQKHNVNIEAKFYNSHPKNLNYNFGINFEYTNINKNKLKDEERVEIKPDEFGDLHPSFGGRSYQRQLFGSDVYKGIEKLNYSIFGNFSYTYIPTDNLEITLGVDSKLTLEQKKQIIFKEKLEARKKAADTTIAEAKHKREELSEEELKERNDKIKELEKQVKEFDTMIEAFNNKNDFSTEIDKYYNKENMRSKKRSDLEAVTNEFKDIIKNKNVKEIQDLFEEKSKEFENLQKENNIDKKNYRNFFTGFYDSKEEKIKKLTEVAKKMNINNPEDFAKKYNELSEYKSGYYSRLKSDILNQGLTLNRKKSAKSKELVEFKNEIYPDETILKFYNDLVDSSKFKYTLKADIEPFTSIEYSINNFTLNGSFRAHLHLEKELKEGSKTKNHIDFNTSIGLTYYIR